MVNKSASRNLRRKTPYVPAINQKLADPNAVPEAYVHPCRYTNPRIFPRNQAEILERARENYKKASIGSTRGLPEFGNRWGSFQKTMAARIATFHSCDEAIDYGQQCGFDHRSPLNEKSAYNIELAVHFLRYEYQHFAQHIDNFKESPFSLPSSLLFYPGTSNPISEVMYFHAFYVLTLLSFDPTISRICEIGGGYGNPAWLWFRNSIHRVDHYTIIDMPESLFFAEVFLSLSLPDVSIKYIIDPKDMDDTDAHGKSITLCPIQHHAETKRRKYDVVVNTGSYSEMTDEWVEFWGQWLGKQKTRLFYSHNMFGNPVDKLYEGRSTYAPIVPENWEIAFIRTMHSMVLLQSGARRFAEMIFRCNSAQAVKQSNVESTFAAMRGKKLTLSDYIWFAYNINRHTSLSTQLDFIEKIRHDFGYDPVELIRMTTNVLKSRNLLTLDQKKREYIENLNHSLCVRFKQHLPKGSGSI
jgi:putative sugar O-methyltransferase